jgi:hypothetical protein
MDTSALKSFAPAVRRHLMEAVSSKLSVVLSAKTPDLLTTYAPQVKKLRDLEAANRLVLIERVAYTWFNRLAALRYLDARGWHPFGARVLTAAGPDETQPELLKLVRNGALPAGLRKHTDPSRLDDLLDGKIPSADPQGEVYRHLVLAACRFYHALLPDLFERIDDETELLLPDDLLTEQSVAQGFRTEIRDEDCAEVEILGWIYQFYISEKKKQVMDRKAAVPTEDIPAVTQLFTPHWIVRYLVENSLGRLWLLNRPSSRLRDQMPYYIEGEPETEFLRISLPEEIRVLDPAVGSGHMLTYAFDLLYAIYEEEGYAPQEIPGLILKHNLNGLDICPRATQLASLALVLKARERSSRFFQGDRFVRPQILAFQDTKFEEDELRGYIKALDLGDLFNQPVLQLLEQFEEATTFGSLIQPCLDKAAIELLWSAFRTMEPGGHLFLAHTDHKVRQVISHARTLVEGAHVVVANPPYIGYKQLNSDLRNLGADGAPYEPSGEDLFAMFIQRNLAFAKDRGYVAMITMDSWMAGDDYNQFREWLYGQLRVCTLAHFGPHAFDEIPGEVVQTAAFVAIPTPDLDSVGHYFRLVSEPDSSAKEARFLAREHHFTATIREFLTVPRKILAYYATNRTLESFRTGRELRQFAEAMTGLQTGDNPRFIRYWYEVGVRSIAFGCQSRAEALGSEKRWFPYVKGSDFRKWYGNLTNVVDWFQDGRSIRSHPSSTVRNQEFYFKEGLAYNNISKRFCVRYVNEGHIFDQKNSMFFSSDHNSAILALGLLNSPVVSPFLEVLSPKDFNPGSLKVIPILPQVLDGIPSLDLTNELISIARSDWNASEQSWDFQQLPLLSSELKQSSLSQSWQAMKKNCEANLMRCQALETKVNELFLRAYGLEGEVSPEVPEDQITLSRPNRRKDLAAFLSYAVGCMMGRYGLDRPGLILADSGDTISKYVAKVGKPFADLTFQPDADGIVPVLDGEWFADDIVARVREFLKATFGEAKLRENIKFIEESLGKEIRKYFLTDFYKDHLQTYKKRPIYWLAQSPGKGFSALIYLHRYNKDTVNNLLNRYLREYQTKLRGRLATLGQIQTRDGASAKEKTDARKEADKLARWLHDCEEWERSVVLPLAQERKKIDLDDGVKINYQKFPGFLAPIPGLAAADD